MSRPINPNPEKAEPHVVTALISKHAELAGRIGGLQMELKQAVIDLDNVEATLRIFAPHIDIPGIAPRPLPPIHQAFKGETSRVVLEALRHAVRPLTTTELTERVMKERGLAIDNAPLFRTMSKRVGACLRHWKNERGMVRSMPGVGQTNMWQLVPAELMPKQLGDYSTTKATS